MKRISALIAVAFASAVVAGGTFFCLRKAAPSTTVTVLFLDQNLSPHHQASITEFCCQQPTPDIATVLTQFPAVRHACRRHEPHHAPQLQLRTHAPTLLVNDQFVLTNAPRLLARELFAPQVLTDLPHLTMDHDADTPLHDEMHRYLHAFSRELLTTHALHWQTPTRIWLYPKQTASHAILFSIDTRITPALLQECSRILHQHEAKGATTKKKPMQRWVADIRFKDQVIAYSMPGGINHG